MKKKHGKKSTLKKLSKERRMKNARKWLDLHWPDGLLEAYCSRCKVSEVVACNELFELGYGGDVRIEQYERDGIEWEYKVDGYTGEMKVVPKGTPDWELHLF